MYANSQPEEPGSAASVAFSPQVAPSASLLLCVIIPVRNEAAHLIKTLDALKNQRDPSGAPLDHGKYEILLLVNNCTDDSYQLAKDYQHAWPELTLRLAQVQLPAERAHIGTARRILMDAAHQRFMLLGRPQGIIASTDGDTEVDATWVYHIIVEMKKGVDAVGGRILVSRQNDAPNTYHSLDETYRMLVARTESLLDPLEYDPWPRHHQYFGASLAVTCKMYEVAGRLPQLPYLEDNAFYNALVRSDAKIRRSTAVKVTTSSRQVGRVAIGLSEQLRKWALMEQQREPHLVAPAAEIVFRANQRRILRECWKQTVDGKIHDSGLPSAAAQLLEVNVYWLQTELAERCRFGELWEKTEPQLQVGGRPAQWQPVDVTQAIVDLTAFVKAYRNKESALTGHQKSADNL